MMKGMGVFTAGSFFGLTIGAACGLVAGIALGVIIIDDATDTALNRIKQAAREGTATV